MWLWKKQNYLQTFFWTSSVLTFVALSLFSIHHLSTLSSLQLIYCDRTELSALNLPCHVPCTESDAPQSAAWGTPLSTAMLPERSSSSSLQGLPWWHEFLLQHWRETSCQHPGARHSAHPWLVLTCWSCRNELPGKTACYMCSVHRWPVISVSKYSLS